MARTIGTGKQCPRCRGSKPSGRIGKGISLSRRGPAYICSDCGTEEAMIDFCRGEGPQDAMLREERLRTALRGY
jgi:hypothetical protein